MGNRKHKRRIKLIKPKLQLRLIGSFLGLSALGFLMQAMMVGMLLSETAGELPEGGAYLLSLLPGLPIEILLLSFGLFLPLITAVGILLTHRIAGPVYRFEEYIKGVLKGEQLGPCHLRKGDQLWELCHLITEVTEPLRRRELGPHALTPASSEESDAQHEESQESSSGGGLAA